MHWFQSQTGFPGHLDLFLVRLEEQEDSSVSIPDGLPRPFRRFTKLIGYTGLGRFQSQTGFPGHLDRYFYPSSSDR